jgi:hypothetical protein
MAAWNIFLPFGTFYGLFVYFVVVWHIVTILL